MNPLLATIHDALYYLEEEDNWCQEAYARNSSKKAVSVHSKDACQWCSQGIIWKVAPDSTIRMILTQEFKNFLGCAIHVMNDNHPYDFVIKQWREFAIHVKKIVNAVSS